jgi:hypothetical protein
LAGLRNTRNEYGIETIVTVGFMHYWIGISLKLVREVMEFLTGLCLSKSQVNSLVNQLSTDREQKYDTIAELLAQQQVFISMKRVGKQKCYP